MSNYPTYKVLIYATHINVIYRSYTECPVNTYAKASRIHQFKHRYSLGVF